jgi:hypothetical protein
MGLDFALETAFLISARCQPENYHHTHPGNPVVHSSAAFEVWRCRGVFTVKFAVQNALVTSQVR